MAAQPKALELEHLSYLEDPRGIWNWLVTVDHKRVAMLYGVTALFFLAVGGFEAMMMRTQLMTPDAHFVSAGLYNELFTMHGTTMIFLVLMPLNLGFFANYLIPLQIGARDVAFPRINALSYWVFLAGAIFMHLGLLRGLGVLPDAGWFGYANLTEYAYSPGLNIDFWDLGLLVLGISTLLSGLNFFVTIVNMRAPGMTFMRMPMFIWAILITTILILLAFPVLTVGLVFLFGDRFFGTHFYRVAAGATPILWQHLFWIFGHPEVYILALPAFGIISEVIPTFSRKPLFGYPMMAYSIILIGFLSYGVWGHHMFATGMGPIADSAFMITSMLIAIPTGIKIFSWIATIWGGRLRFTTSFLFALGFIVEFTMGGLSGIMHASAPVDLQQTDSYIVVAHFHYVLFGGVLMALLAGIYYWWPKITGRFLNEKIGKWQFWITLWAFNATFFPMHFLGTLGMPRRIYTYAPHMGWTFWNHFETINAFILGFAFALFFFNLWWSSYYGEQASSDPWDARTLEWSVPSPPPAYNFVTVPAVTTRDAWWTRKYGGPSSPPGIAPAVAGGAGGAGTIEAVPAPGGLPAAEHIHMPAPSLYPLLFGLGLFMMAIGALDWIRIVCLGFTIVVISIFGMVFEYPKHGRNDPHAVAESALGVDSRKMGMWTFIGSECVFFAALISTYMVYKSRNLGGPDASILEIPLTSFSTFILLTSSLLMVLALSASQRNKRKWAAFWLFGTAGFGLIFVLGQCYEFWTFYMKGLFIQSNLFGQTFYTLVGFHGLHVFIGVCWLLVLAFAALKGEMGKDQSLAVEIGGLYWHFVDIVWVIIFTLVYLMRTVKHG
ncbi:MAG: cytochrome c oxidase subunit I [Candidatus Binataceae bacterium]